MKFKKDDTVKIVRWIKPDGNENPEHEDIGKIGRIINIGIHSLNTKFPYEVEYYRTFTDTNKTIFKGIELKKPTKKEIELFNQQMIENEI